MFTSQGRPDGASPSLDPEDKRQQRVLEQFHSYPFSSDEEFQQGLAGILAHHSTHELSDSEKSELVLKTKVFYFDRLTGHSLSLADAQGGYAVNLDRFRVESGDEYGHTSSGAGDGERRVLTFAELKSLIEEGKTDEIPNNKIIPDILNRIDRTVAEKALGTLKPIVIHMVDHIHHAQDYDNVFNENVTRLLY